MFYLDLEKMSVKKLPEEQEMITRFTTLAVVNNGGIKAIYDAASEVVKVALNNTEQNKVYNFYFDVKTEKEMDEDEFETTINILLTAFFKHNELKIGRPRERRLDVPDNLKQNVNCSMSLLKSAINIQTRVNKFQITLANGDLRYEMVGEVINV